MLHALTWDSKDVIICAIESGSATPSTAVSNPHSPLRLNVGFIIHQTIGFSHEFQFDLREIRLPPDLQLNDLTGVARFTRTPQGLLAQVKMHAQVQADCVRCLTTFTQSLNIDFAELYAFSGRSITDAGLILPEEGFIDLEPLVREYMLLDVPINPLCKPDCKGLCPICGENLNETTCHHDETPLDPRLTALKSLLD